MSKTAIEVSGLHKSYRMGRTDLHVLRGISFEIPEGDFTAIVGASGSGKSTLLHLIGLLDRPDRGEVTLDGVPTGRLPAKRRNRIRCEDVGFVFQFYHLLPELNVLQNVLLPARVGASMLSWPARRKGAFRRAHELLEHLGLSDRLAHRPSELSGGEMQRVAIARGLINHPRVLLADEPTGNLDSKTGAKIMEVLKRFHRELNQTVVMVTHDASLAEQADRIMRITDGRVART
jgi:lipoprotein-releasing system ATP-binding protein